jgi:hypothetical protein
VLWFRFAAKVINNNGLSVPVLWHHILFLTADTLKGCRGMIHERYDTSGNKNIRNEPAVMA